METRTYTVYKFDELSEHAKSKAIQDLCYINVDDNDWADCIIAQWKEEMELKGYHNITPYWSGFSSQGDGACFECTIDLEEWIVSHKMKSKLRNVWNSAVKQGMDYTLKTVHSGHYYHSGCMPLTAEAYGYPDKAYSEFHDVLVPAIEEDARACADDLYNRLRETYNFQTSEEQIIEAIKANDYDFTEDGKID